MEETKFKRGDKVFLKSDKTKEIGTIVKMEYSEVFKSVVAMCDFPNFRNLQVSPLDSLEIVYQGGDTDKQERIVFISKDIDNTIAELKSTRGYENLVEYLGKDLGEKIYKIINAITE